MVLLKLLPQRTPLLPLLLLAMSSGHTHALTQTYCSNQNTGSDNSPLYSIYQSNGLCHDNCLSGYAFAVVQYQDCWCSNYIPEDQLDISECDQTCPGYPAEECGDSNSGLYGYIALTLSPSGTQSASSATSSSISSSQQSTTSTSSLVVTTSTSSTSTITSASTTITSTSTILVASTTISKESASSSQTTQTAVTVYQTSTISQSPSVIVSYVTPSTSSTDSTTSTSTTSTTSTTSSASSTSSATVASTSSITTTTTSASSTTGSSASAVVSTRIVTVSGAMVTQTVTSTPTPASSTGLGLTEAGHHTSLSGGSIAGIVIGVLAGIILLLLAGFLFWRRRRSNARNPESAKAMTRNASVLSKAGLLASLRTGENEKMYDESTYPATAGNSQRHSALYGGPGAEPSATDALVPAIGGVYGSPDEDGRRNSRPLVYDQRLNPAALMQNWEQNGSRTSVGTMQDQRDYSRPLNVTNPDLAHEHD